MKPRIACSLALLIGTLAAARGARAERVNPFATPGEKPRAIYRWIEPSAVPQTPATVSHIIYLNDCKPNGCTLHPGNDNSLTDTSSVPNSTSLVSPYQGSAANWSALVNCVQQSYAPFNVQIVTTRPAPGTNYHMAIVAGHASDVGEPQGVLGVSPFSCGYIPNSISFTFANEEATNILDLCWTVSQETAHSWGLDHKFDNRDPMTYLGTGPQQKVFQNQAGPCGEYNSRACSCSYQGTGTSAMNSYALIEATFGLSAPDTTPPTVTITSPANNASVMTGFTVTADISDDQSVQKAQITIDGTAGATLTGAPWTWTAPANIGQGSHHIIVKAWDNANNTASAMVDATIGSGCHSASDCMTAGDTCVDGHCVAGMDTPGGLGTVCMNNSECASGSCAADQQGHMYCVVACDPTMRACPSGFGCVATGASGGVCWPGADTGGGGGCSTGSSPATLLVGLALAALVVSRRRR